MEPETDAGLPADDETLHLLPGGSEGEDDFGYDPAAAAGLGEGEDDEAPAPAPAPRRGAQERIDELTRLRREAERERDHWREQALRAQAPATAPGGAPDPADYPEGEADPAFLRDLGRYEGQLELVRLAEAHQAQAEALAVERSWNERQQAFARDRPDYVWLVHQGPEWPCTPPMADAIRTSEAGPAVAYHLAKHPDEARRICGLPPLAQVREIGRLEARLGGASATHRQASNAPGPAPQLKGQGGRFRVSPDTDDFAAFDKAY